jgi:nitrate reductase delta subunit
MRTFKALSALLAYPDDNLIEMLPEIRAVIREEAKLPAEVVGGIDSLIDAMAGDDLLALQERYVALFDRVRSLSLHLFEHVHGDSRARGQAMIDLGALYSRNGFDLSVRELPDYLPVFLEYLSFLPESEARSLLDDASHIAAAIGDRLAKRNEPYAAVLGAIVRLAEHTPERSDIAQLVSTEGDESPEALDKSWEEEPVIFGPSAAPAAGCSRVAGILDKIDPRKTRSIAAE